MPPEVAAAAWDLLVEVENLAEDIGQQRPMWQKWDDDEKFINSTHMDLDVESSAPNAGDLEAGEVRLGDGTGPNGRDEIFISTDGQTVARYEADSIIS